MFMMCSSEKSCACMTSVMFWKIISRTVRGPTCKNGMTCMYERKCDVDLFVICDRRDMDYEIYICLLI